MDKDALSAVPYLHPPTISNHKIMEWIHWDKVLATGHSILDTDHEHLVDLFNQLGARVKKRMGTRACVEILDKIIQLSKVHFAFEELLMAEQQYPEMDEHRAEHTRLIAQAIRYKAKIETEAADLHIPMIHFPEDWLTFHIQSADRKFAAFLFSPD